MIRLILGFLQPSAGSARFRDLDCYADSVEVHRYLAYLPGEARLFGRMRGRGVLEFFSQLHPAANHQRALELAERLELDLNRPVALCSTGMRQKIALVATLSIDVPLVILDEPTSSLDPTVRRQVANMVRESKCNGQTVLFSSHVLSEVEDVCDRAFMLRHGKHVHTQVISELRQQHRIHARLSGSLSSPPAPLADELEINVLADESVEIQTGGALPDVLRWLATLPLTDVQIEPIRLQAIYDRYHPPEAQ